MLAQSGQLVVARGVRNAGAGTLPRVARPTFMRASAVLVLVFLCAGCDLGRDRRGYTPLILASIDGDVDRVTALLREGADPNECAGGSGYTVSPLVIASGRNHVRVVETLLAAGAKPDQSCRETPLDLAIHNGSVEAMRALIRGGADVTFRYPGGGTYLMAAAIAAYPETVPVLVEAGCPIDAVHPRDGQTALMVAAAWDAGMTRALLDAGANVHLRDREGKTALDHAMERAKQPARHTSPGKWDLSILRMLREAGAGKISAR